MKTKFSNKGNYVIAIQGLKENEKLDFDKPYTFYIYHYKTKKTYNEFAQLIKTEHILEEMLDEKDLKEVCVGEKLPRKIDNIKMYLDLDNNKVLDESISDEKTELKTRTKDSNKFYLTIIENESIDDVFFFDIEYMQTTYEFDTNEELDSFINQENRNKVPFESVTTTLSKEKQKNVIYLLENGVNKKVLEHEFILKIDELGERERTIVVFWPSMDAYVIGCHEDMVYKGICELPEISKGEMDVNNIFSAIEDNLSFANFDKKILKRQHIGKMTSFDFDGDGEIPKCLISNYLCVNYIFDKESLEYLNKIRNLELAYNKALNDKGCVKEFLMMMHIIDEKGKVLAPFNEVIYQDSAKEKVAVKTKTNKKSIN